VSERGEKHAPLPTRMCDACSAAASMLCRRLCGCSASGFLVLPVLMHNKAAMQQQTRQTLHVGHGDDSKPTGEHELSQQRFKDIDLEPCGG